VYPLNVGLKVRGLVIGFFLGGCLGRRFKHGVYVFTGGIIKAFYFF
jgi:hypothetical protein